ncbi:MAG: signal recognition particle-docking protein FtsY [Candidatus Marsarchaeota archaeon]|nr:signal recognition particle-docking protein FtsY [Candidatus Marsarchaeota archaeon]MCL5413186.1 signal recognition particle-docking protein FtsY [Candidatus Marsarchaeota archaeon]
MFDGLKKKFSSFIDSLSNKEKEEMKQEEAQVQSGPVQEVTAMRSAGGEVSKSNDAPQTMVNEDANGEPAPKQLFQTIPKAAQQEVSDYKPALQNEDAKKTHAQRATASQPKVTATTKIKGFIFGKTRISDKDVNPFIEDLMIGMLQSDVNYDIAEKMAMSIRNGLVGKEISSKGMNVEIRKTMRNAIMDVLTKGSDVDIVKRIREESSGNLPFKIMFIGPNGAGKTTTMAKIASMLLSDGISCVLSASDTFRAAAIEQTAYHASKLGINVIKGTYGADPASVAFDAIAHAKAHGIMAVLIDSAGRQETNKSLIEELKKMARIAKPNLKIFVGESISGNALLEQVKAINDAIGLDGIILTKLDVDAKGGNTLSILGDTTVPILFFGTGEKYTDIMRYDPGFVVDNILPNN